MILVDANLLVYAHVRSFPEHKAAKAWLDASLSGPVSVGIPWSSITAFIRLVTNPRVFEKPEPVHEAWGQVKRWLAARTSWIPNPTDRHVELLESFIPYCTKSSLVQDAHVATLAVEHGLLLCSTDGDFARFPSLRWKNPLV